jgi:rhamnogalacturonyl hydrolase YesR
MKRTFKQIITDRDFKIGVCQNKSCEFHQAIKKTKKLPIKWIVLICLMIGSIMNCNAGSTSKKAEKFSERVASDFIRRFPNPDSIHWDGQTNHFSWQAGYIMFAMEKMWKATGDSIYLHYVRRYVDQQVDEEGNVPDFKNNALDNFIPGNAILFLYEITGLRKYRVAANRIRHGFDNYPRASNGLFWHATDDWAKGQVWVDGVFMGQMFLARYGKQISDSEYASSEVVKQMTLIIKKCQKPNGLLLHGWNENKTATWADKNSGLAPEVWSEGLGWFAILIADVFNYLPKDIKGRDELILALQKLCQGLKESQDTATGMWCQVVDKCGEPGNWNETSGTGMFMYLIEQSIQRGFISKEEYEPVVKAAYNGIIKKVVINSEGFIDLIDCSSIGIQNSYNDYISQPKEVSTFAAFASFILGTGVFELGL